MKNNKTQYLAFMALFLAIEIVLVVTPLGYIQLGLISATIMHIPVIIAGISLGRKAGAQLGFVFGLTSMLNATFRPGPTSFIFSPFITVAGVSGNWTSLIIAFVPRILTGYLSGLIYQQLQKRNVNDNICVIVAALVGTLTNTVLVLSGIYLFFGPQYAQIMNIAYQALIGVIFTIVATNGIGEAILAVISSLLICKAIAPITKKINK